GQLTSNVGLLNTPPHAHSPSTIGIGAWIKMVRVASVEALGQMVGLITRTQLKAALPRLVPTILDLYKKDLDIAFLATCSLHNLLNASLLSESGPPMLDFEDLTLTLATLLPVVSMNSENKDQSVFSVGLKVGSLGHYHFLEIFIVCSFGVFG
ncbi:hypothetical protein L195_g031206, partial [Trifolium pratense]